jgi:ankyrin repeat protein
LANAASKGDTNTVTLLINAGADINTADNNDLNALLYATFAGQTEMVKLLIDADADVNIAIEKNVTALKAAVSEGHTEIVKLLVKAGADISNTTLLTTDREKLKKAQEGEVDFSLVKDEIKDEIRMLIYSEGEYIDVESVKIVDGNQEGFYDATLNTTDGVNKLMKNVEKDLANTIIGKSIPVFILDTKYKYGSSSVVKITME